MCIFALFVLLTEKYAKHWCGLLTNREGPFAGCHYLLNPSTYYMVCWQTGFSSETIEIGSCTTSYQEKTVPDISLVFCNTCIFISILHFFLSTCCCFCCGIILFQLSVLVLSFQMQRQLFFLGWIYLYGQEVSTKAG